jgi:TonB family protein
MKRVLFATILALAASATFAAVELYQLPDGTTMEVMHPGVDGVTRPMARADAAIAPAYPQLPRPLGEDSSVVMAVLVDVRGEPIVLDVLEASHPGYGFEDAAADAVFKWKFDPAEMDGEPVTSYTKVRVKFPRSAGGGARGGLVGSLVPGGSPNYGDTTRLGRDAAMDQMAGSLTPEKMVRASGDTPQGPTASGLPPSPRLQRGPSFAVPPQGQLYFKGHPEWGFKLYGGGGTSGDPDAPWR